MAIPSEDEFNALLSATEAQESKESKDFTLELSKLTASFKRTGVVDCDQLRSVIGLCCDHTQEVQDYIFSLPAGKWFSNQPSFHKAWDNLHTSRRGKRYLTEEEYISQLSEYIINSIKVLSKEEYIDQLKSLNITPIYNKPKDGKEEVMFEGWNSVDSRLRRLVRRLEREYNGVTKTPLSSIITSFKKYFYSRDHLDAYTLKVDLDRLCDLFNKLNDCVNELETKRDILASVEIGSVDALKDVLNRNMIQSRITKIEKFRESRYSNIPINRNDRTARERWLIYNLWRSFKKLYRSDKTTAIWHLLSLEGIENQVELRTVERAVTTFKRGRRQPDDSRW